MPDSFVTSANLAAGISVAGLCGATGALSEVSLAGPAAGLRLMIQITAPAIIAKAITATIDQRKARPITASSRCATSSSGSGRLITGGLEGSLLILQRINHNRLRRVVCRRILPAMDGDGAVARVVVWAIAFVGTAVVGGALVLPEL